MSDDKLNSLNQIDLPEPRAEARKRALVAAMTAFEAAQAKKTSPAAQGMNWGDRLRSIVQPKRGTWIMDTRLTYGLGTAAVALLLLPLGYQLYSSTALTPVVTPPVIVNRPVVEQPVSELPVTDQPVNELPLQDARKDQPLVATPADDEARDRLAQPGQDVVTGPVPAELRAGTREEDADLSVVDLAKAVEPAAPPVTVASQTLNAQPLPAPSPKLLMPESEAALGRAANPVGEAGLVAPEPMVTAESMPMTSGTFAAPDAMAPGYVGGSPAQNVTTPSGDQFTTFVESPVKQTATEPVSTFSIDVDTASYTYVRQALENGYIPEPDAVRIEEMVNYFSYDYQGPDSAEAPFKPNVAIYPTPWNPKTQLLHIGIKGYEPPASADEASNLVFLIDTSGSMEDADKLPLLKRAFALLVNQLSANDTVSIVVYAGSAGIVLEPTRATEKAKILAALENLSAGGSTAGAEGIELAYRLAEQSKIANGTNRVILATDGDFNVGIEDPEDLKTYIKEKRDTGIFLSVLGFGEGNYGDDTMQALAQNGNGNAAYIDSFREAQKVLVAEGGGTLETIAKDVKIQIEFNPAFVSEYRLVGYETRALNREDFNNDRVDAGDIGAGHTVTAIYEITPTGSGGELVDPLRYGGEPGTPVAAVMPSDEIAFLKLRYKLPNEDVSKLIEMPVTRSIAVDSVNAASEDERFAAAVAAFGQKLKGSNYGDMTWAEIRTLAQGARGADESGYRAEFIQLVDGAAMLNPDQIRD